MSAKVATARTPYRKLPLSKHLTPLIGLFFIQANASCREQKENARENPLAAAAAAAAATGAPTTSAGTNAENLLDIDFDGTAPASTAKEPAAGLSGLEGLAGTPQRVASPAVASSATTNNNMDDLMGVFGNGGGSQAPLSAGGWGGAMADTPVAAPSSNANAFGGMGMEDDMMNGFASLDMSAGAGASQPPPPQQQKKPATANEDILGLF